MPEFERVAIAAMRAAGFPAHAPPPPPHPTTHSGRTHRTNLNLCAVCALPPAHHRLLPSAGVGCPRRVCTGEAAASGALLISLEVSTLGDNITLSRDCGLKRRRISRVPSNGEETPRKSSVIERTGSFRGPGSFRWIVTRAGDVRRCRRTVSHRLRKGHFRGLI